MELPTDARSVLRPHDAGSALLGGLNAQSPARVDRAGSVGPDGAPWSVETWIGGPAGWVVPSLSASVRQERPSGAPLVVTRVRIGGGDIVQTAYQVPTPHGPITVVDINNETDDAVALAVAVRPYGICSVDHPEAHRVGVKGRVLLRNGRPAVVLARPPSEALASADPNESPRRLLGGAALDLPRSDVGAEGTGAAVTVVLPLPHRASTRFAVLTEDVANADALNLNAVPTPAEVERGWDALMSPAGRVELPESGLSRQLDVARGRIRRECDRLEEAIAELAPGAGVLLEAAATAGFDNEVELALVHLARWMPPRSRDGRGAAALVRGLAASAPHVSDALRVELLAPAVELTSRAERFADPTNAADAVTALGRLALAAGQDGPSVQPLPALDGVRQLDAISEMAAAAGENRAWGHDEWLPAAQFWLRARALLVDDRTGVVDLVPSFPPQWRGGNMEVHGLSTLYGRVSAAIRWHGARPALLWETTTIEGVAAMELRCSGLDPDFSTTEPSGETLLAGTADGLAVAPGSGESFS